MRPAGLVLQRFTTDGLAPGERHEAWVNRDWPSLAPIYRTTPLAPFDTVSDCVRLGGLIVHYSRMSAQRWERDASMLRSHGPDGLGVTITLAGEARGTMGELAFRTGPGSVQLVDLAQTSDHESTASRTILVAVPRQIATVIGLDVAALHGAVLKSGAAAMLAPHLLRMREAVPELSVAEGPLLARTILDLLAVAAVSSGRVSPDRGRAGAAAARAEIEKLLGSPALTVASLSRRLGMSRSSLHRLFEAEGGAQAYIRDRRLEAARRALADPANGEPIYALAERLGFSDAAHLSRLFRVRYGLTPSDHRTHARAG